MDERFEQEVQALAREIAAAGASERANLFHLGRWSERVLDWAMSHPAFKTQLFRFVDVFPACRDDADVLRHLGEYFAGVEMPRALGLGLEVAERVPFGAFVSTAAARRNILRMARQLIAGASPADALPRLERLWQAGEASTVDLLGEKTVTEREAARYAERVAEMLEALVAGTGAWPAAPRLERDPWGPVPRVNLSVKPTALSPRFAPTTAADGIAEARERLLPILRRAREAGATIHLDMEHDDVKDTTLALLRTLGAEFADGPQLGCVIQAYRKDSFRDLCEVVAWSEGTLRLPLAVRLVKGAYWDFETVVATAEGWPVPVFEKKRETDASYERCVRHLVEHAGGVRPAFGSHNLRSIAYAIACTRARGLPSDAVEHQLLYGMAEPIHAALARLGYRVRVYAPVGDLVAGMAYLVRRLLENTSNESFIRHRFAEGVALDELVQPPPVERLPEPEEAVERAPTDPSDPGPFANEPHAELRRPAVRERLVAAVSGARLGFEAPVLIEGRPVATGDSIVSVDPGDVTTVVCRSGRAGPAEAVRAIEAAGRAWPAWRATPWRERAAVLIRAAAIMRRRRAELAALELFEAGKPIPEADADVCEAIDFCEYYGREALRLAAGAPLGQVPGEANAYRYQPRGIGVVIAPWNFPLAIPAG
ncbi:MAG TPA: proline dehydrogenase family protein, partial [Candidatus Binatus sp.]|nr:proline dehydrogenase family protein [Candidatus Binatus sp.]